MKSWPLVGFGVVISALVSLLLVIGDAVHQPTSRDLLGNVGRHSFLALPVEGEYLSLASTDVEKIGKAGARLVVAPRCTSCSVRSFSPESLRGSEDRPILVFYLDQDDPRIGKTSNPEKHVHVSKSKLTEHIPYSLFEAAPTTVIIDEDCRILEVVVD